MAKKNDLRKVEKAAKKARNAKPAKPAPKKPARTPRGSRNGGSGGFFKLLFSTPIRQLLLIVIIVVLLAVFWDQVASFFDTMLDTLGWGLALVVGAIVMLITLFITRHLSSLWFRWNRWIGAVAFAFMVWGILAAIDYTSPSFSRGLGGTFGREIIDFPNSTWVYVLRILALAVIGVLITWPTACLRGIRALWVWLVEELKRRPEAPGRKPAAPAGDAKRPVQLPLRPAETEERKTLPGYMEEPLVPPEVETSRKKLEELAARAAALRPATDAIKVDKPRVETKKFPAGEAGAAPAKMEKKQTAAEVRENLIDNADLEVVDGWPLPPIDILDSSQEVQFSHADNEQRAKLIEETLASYGVDARVVQINAGPTVTQFGVEPGWDRKYKEIKEKDEDGNVQVRLTEVSKTRVKAGRISALSNDLALALAAPSIRIEAPVPGKTFVGVEVPNVTSDMVSLRGVIETSTFQKLSGKTKMAIALGKGAGGEAVAADLTKMPHLLIAGATGSGKTVCLNTIVCGLLMFNSPNDLRFILIDPKRVELTQYNSIPHLATPVIVETPKALAALRWLCQEMDERYQKFSKVGARNIEGYNKDKTGAERMPYLVLVIDELADLMMAGFDEVETNLCRLAQLARATGIHLVVATQRPSVDVVTGLIKANFPTRLSFAVTSQVDSRTILDSPGAEKLLGHGDMLYLPTDAAKPKRLQGCFLSDAEIDRLVYFWSSQQAEEPDRLRMETLVATTPNDTIGGHPKDPLLEQAKELAHQYEEVSTSFLQRKLHIGYPRAARLKEQLDAVLEQEAAAEEEKIETAIDEIDLEDDIIPDDEEYSE